MRAKGRSAGLVVVAAAWAFASAPACGVSPGRSGEGFDAGRGSSSGGGGSGGSGSGGSGSSSGVTTFGDGGPTVGGSSSGGGGPGCSQAAEYVYVIGANATLYQFNPPTLAFTQVGQVTCAPSQQIFSMAVDRNAVAWVLALNGSVVKYDINTKACTLTSFAPNQHNFQTFGMGFSTDAAGSANETLFVSDSELYTPTGGGLAKIDTSALALSPIAQYDQGFNSRRAEMTGTGDGRLYAAFEGTPYVVAEIDKTTAHIKSQAPQTPINYPPDSSNFAFAFWGGDFWLFVGPGATTDVFQYRPSTGMTTKRETENFEIVGAGVSTCAPTTPPQ